jgi:hypothetical protein
MVFQGRQVMDRLARSLRGMLGATLPAIAIVLTLSTGSFAADDTCKIEPTDATDVRYLADWIAGLQYDNPALSSHGAITIHHSPGWVDAGGYAYDVVPYSANLAITALLGTDVPGKLTVAQNWIRWYLGHLQPDGSIANYWYRADGSGERTCVLPGNYFLCNYADAADTTAATFLGMVLAYHEAGGDATFLKANRASFEKIGGLVLSLQQKDGLTWAADKVRLKFLMNNSEVYWGLRSMASLEHKLFSNQQAGVYNDAAERVRQGIDKSLYDQKARLYRVAEYENGALLEADLDQWYEATVSLAWPTLFGVISATSDRARQQMAAVNGSWDGTLNPDWTVDVADPSGFLWPSIGRAAQLTGDCARARTHANFVKAEKFPGMDWPWTVEDAGWLLRTLNGFGK